jgi:hypothetical protein
MANTTNGNQGEDPIRNFINGLDKLDKLKAPPSHGDPRQQQRQPEQSSDQEPPVARPYTGPLYQFGFVVTENGEAHFTIAGKTTAPQPGEVPDMLAAMLDILTSVDQERSGEGSGDDEVLPVRILGDSNTSKGSTGNSHEPPSTGNQMDYLFGALGDIEKDQEEFDQTLLVQSDKLDELEVEVHQLKNQFEKKHRPWWVRMWRAFWFLDLDGEDEPGKENIAN